MPDEPIRQIHTDGRQIAIYNSGPTIFVYDEAHADAIKAENPSLLAGYYASPAQDVDAPLLALGSKGQLVVFELYQDDEFRAELRLVAGPIAATESEGIPWSAPKTAYLNLPTGALCIESMDSLRLGPDEPGDAGAQIMVPPGDYLFSVQCLSPEYEQDPEALIPEYYLSLVPLSSYKDRPANQPFLSYPRG